MTEMNQLSRIFWHQIKVSWCQAANRPLKKKQKTTESSRILEKVTSLIEQIRDVRFVRY